MAPGVIKFKVNTRDWDGWTTEKFYFEWYWKNWLVWVYVWGNPRWIWIGEWWVKTELLSEGVAVKVLHRFGDSLWELNPEIPEGFTNSLVKPIVNMESSSSPTKNDEWDSDDENDEKDSEGEGTIEKVEDDPSPEENITSDKETNEKSPEERK